MMNNSYRTSSSKYTLKTSQVRSKSQMEQTIKETPTTYYDSTHKMQITLTFTSEIPRNELDDELSKLIETNYINKTI